MLDPVLAFCSIFTEVVFSTAHKAKGLEFDTVRLAEDFLADVPIQLMSKLFVAGQIKSAFVSL